VPVGRHAWVGLNSYLLRLPAGFVIGSRLVSYSLSTGVQFGSGKGEALNNLFDTASVYKHKRLQIRVGQVFYYNIRRGAAASKGVNTGITVSISKRWRVTGEISSLLSQLGQDVVFDTNIPPRFSSFLSAESIYSTGFSRQLFKVDHMAFNARAGMDYFSYTVIRPNFKTSTGAYLGVGWETSTVYANMVAHWPFELSVPFIGFQLGIQLQAL
jgi:hypothetical protein